MTTREETREALQGSIAQKDHAEAIQVLQERVAERDDDDAAHFDLGNLYYAAGMMDEALQHLQKSASLAPENTLYMRSLADLLYSHRQDVDQALSFYITILDAQPDDAHALMMAGHLCVTRERFDDALGYYRHLLDIQPENDDARSFVEQIERRKADGDGLDDPEVAYQRCQEWVGQGDVKMAIAGLERLAAQHPDFSLAHNDLGVLYYQQGDKERCIANYEKAVALDPDNDNFRKNLADFYLAEQGRVEAALEIYLSVLKDNPEDIDALMVAGHICSAIGKNDSAKTFYHRVLDVEPWNFEASERLEALPG